MSDSKPKKNSNTEPEPAAVQRGKLMKITILPPSFWSRRSKPGPEVVDSDYDRLGSNNDYERI